MSEPGIFRTVALERLSSPDRLDRLITITTPQGWLTLLSLGLLISCFAVWSIFGTVPTRVTGHGILVSLGGSVYDAMAPATGNVAVLKVAPGAIVQKGDVIAELTQPAATQQLNHARADVVDLKEELARLTAQFAAEEAAHDANRDRQRVALRNVIEAAKQRAAYYKATLDSYEPLTRSGFISKQRVQENVQGEQQAEQDIKRAESDLVRLDGEALDTADRNRDELTKAQMRLSEAERNLSQLTAQFAATSVVQAPVAGRVIETKVAEGSVVAAGASISSIQSGEQGLELVLYVPPEHGKAVKPGMPVRIEPATVRKEEWGTMLGEVVSISDFPATAEGMRAILQNPQLVHEFAADGPPYAARVRLEPVTGSPGHYRWSSGAGPPILITAGTLAAASVTVREDRPIAFAIPLFRNMTGLAQ
jgi:HlyD family secretion protein